MNRRWWITGLGVLLVMLACNLPRGGATAGPSPGALQTSAALTVQAVLQATQAAGQGSAPTQAVLPTQGHAPTQAPGPTNPSPPVATTLPPPPPPTHTPLPSPTPSTEPCNRATFIKDVTVPDGTAFFPGAAFTKTWRLKNVGTCTWANYSLVFDHGDAMGAPPSVPIPAIVPPGQEVDVSVDLVAPSTPGTYKGYWRLRDDKGVIFGLTNGNPFWVEIKVVSPTATPSVTPSPTWTLPPPAMLVLDFYERASEAHWHNGSGDTLPYPGAGNDARGFARPMNGVTLEDGKGYSHTLETHPEWIDDGYISGEYPAVTVPENAHFRADVGFILKADGTCGVGEVDFELWALYPGHLPQKLAGWHKRCTGALRHIDIAVPSSTQPVYFTLVVRAAGSSAQDWAVWVNPRIETP